METLVECVFGHHSFSPDSLISKQLSISKKLNLFALEKNSAVGDVVAGINSALNTSKNRSEGLLLLHTFIKQCHTKVFQEHCNTWLRMLISILQTYDPAHNLSATCVVLCQLIRSLKQFPELSRDFNSDSLPILVNILLTAKAEWQSEAVLCLCQCMKSYPGACGPFKNKIEQLLLGLLETEDEILQKRVCECFALLARTGGGGNQGVKHTEAWSVYIHRVISTISSTLTELCQCLDLDDVTVTIEHQGSVRFPSQLSDTVDERNWQLTRRLTVLTGIVCNMLQLDFPAVVHVPVKTLLSVIQKALSVTPKYLLSKSTQERMSLASVLPSVYEDALHLLEVLIHCVSSNLVPYCQPVNRCLLQVLKATETKRQYGMDSPYSDVRVSVWQCLYVWVSRVGMSTGIEAVAEEIMTQIHRDFVPLHDTVKLQSGTSKKLGEMSEHFHGSKKKKSSKGQQTSEVGAQKKVSYSADVDMCCGALKALTAILQAAGTLLSPEVYKTFTSAAVGIFTKSASSWSPKSAPIPYSVPRCRLGLYSALLASVQASHPTLAPPVQYIMNVFRMGTQDTSIEVSSFCRTALLAIETIIHPRAPSLNQPIASSFTRTLPKQGTSNTDTLSQHKTIKNLNGQIEEDMEVMPDDGEERNGNLLVTNARNIERDSKNNTTDPIEEHIEEINPGPGLIENTSTKYVAKMQNNIANSASDNLDRTAVQKSGFQDENRESHKENLPLKDENLGIGDLVGDKTESKIELSGLTERTSQGQPATDKVKVTGSGSDTLDGKISLDMDGGSQTLGKRKLEEGNSEVEVSSKKQVLEALDSEAVDSAERGQDDITDLMLQDFVNAEPDSE